MIARASCLALCLLAATGAARAADADGSFAVKGVGLTKCSDFVKAAKEKNAEQIAQYVSWLGGFLTASNQHMTETFDLTPWQNVRTLSGLLASYCDQNADLRFVAAAARLTNALRADRLVTPSELLPIEYEGKTHYMYKEGMRRTQARLAELGLYTGSLDGTYGDGTRAALETFQKENSLPVNGMPDQRTLLLLFRTKKEG